MSFSGSYTLGLDSYMIRVRFIGCSKSHEGWQDVYFEVDDKRVLAAYPTSHDWRCTHKVKKTTTMTVT